MEIPRIPRGSELLWDTRGDPLPKTSEGFDEVNERFNYLQEITFTELSRLYPQTHKMIKEENGRRGNLILDTFHQKTIELPSLYTRCCY